VQVHHDEGVANRIDPESCADAREGIGEALTGERIGQPLSRESTVERGQETFHSVHVEAAQRVAAQAHGAGAERLVHVSEIGSPMLPHDRGTFESAAKANWRSGPFVLFVAHVLFGKPVSTFPDHALKPGREARHHHDHCNLHRALDRHHAE
jgi:hypothetical protein